MLVNAFLIPFFLAGHMVSEKEWEKGPKYVFKAETNVTMSGRNFDLDEVFSHFHTYMICSPKDPNTLNCHFTDGIMMASVSADRRLLLREFNMTKEPFEIKFNNLGAESLTVKSDTDEDMLNMMKAYVRQLTVGANLEDKTEDTQFEMPRSSVEECKANMKYRYNTEMSRSLTYDHDRTSDNDYQLNGLQQLHKPTDKSIEINKERIADECKLKHVFDFDSAFFMFSPQEHMEEIGEKLEEMKSDIAVSNTGFWSNTMRRGILGSKTDQHLNYKESVALTLVDMVEAEDDLPAVADPKTIKIVDEEIAHV